jgi:GNAT superfamily N-acetyltransferase
VRIRPARIDDLDSLVAVHHAAFVAGNGPHLPPEWLADYTLDSSRAGWEPVLEDVPDRAVVAVLEEEGRLRGVAGAGAVRDDDQDSATVGELYALYVHPDEWGCGYGGALHDAARDHLTREGFERAVLWVLEGNERARRFYEARRWSPDGSREDFHGASAIRLVSGLG